MRINKTLGTKEPDPQFGWFNDASGKIDPDIKVSYMEWATGVCILRSCLYRDVQGY